MTPFGIGAATEVLENAKDALSTLSSNLRACTHESSDDTIAECLDLCMEARANMRRCFTRRRRYAEACAMDSLAHKFAILRYEELWFDFNVDFSNVFDSLRSVVDERQHAFRMATSLRRMCEYLRSEKPVSVHTFLLGTSPSSSPPKWDIDDTDHEASLVEWDYFGKRRGFEFSLSVGQYYSIISACRFDRTMFTKSISILRFLFHNNLAFVPRREFLFVSPGIDKIVELLGQIHENKLVWSYLRLPSSTSTLAQLLLCGTLLNTSVAKSKFKFDQKQLLNSFVVALDFFDVVRDIEGMPEALLRPKVRRATTTSYYGEDVESGLVPSVLMELLTRGDYGTVLIMYRMSQVRKNRSKTMVEIFEEYDQVVLKKDPDEISRVVSQIRPKIDHMKKKGNRMFELIKRLPRVVNSVEDRLVFRGDLEVDESGQITITTSDEIDREEWGYVYLPTDESLLTDSEVDLSADEDVGAVITELVKDTVNGMKEMSLNLDGQYLHRFAKPNSELFPFVIEKVDAPHGQTPVSSWTSTEDIVWKSF